MPGGTAVAVDGRRARWEAHNEGRRRRVIDAAIEQIEAGEPGTKVRMQQIVERSGLSRSVIYRLYGDRTELLRAVQTRILEQLWDLLLPQMSLDGTVPQIIERCVTTYVDWAVGHPALHRLAELDLSPEGESPLQHGLERIAKQVAELTTLGLELLGAPGTDDRREATETLAFGMVGMALSSVRHWLQQDTSALGAPQLVDLLTRACWSILDEHARSSGVVLDPDVPMEQLAAAGDGK